MHTPFIMIDESCGGYDSWFDTEMYCGLMHTIIVVKDKRKNQQNRRKRPFLSLCSTNAGRQNQPQSLLSRWMTTFQASELVADKLAVHVPSSTSNLRSWLAACIAGTQLIGCSKNRASRTRSAAAFIRSPHNTQDQMTQTGVPRTSNSKSELS